MNNAPRQLVALQLATALPSTHRRLLERAAQIAEERQVRIFLVGGPVRDLLLLRPITDLDLVVEGDAWPIAEVFCAEMEGKITKHEAFRTAVIECDVNGTQHAIDFVTARRETYPAPAALPVVTPSNMGDDLARRDFTINALALELLPDGVGALLDPFDGMSDIERGIVRVLHDRSFFDDPTRILRATRFAARLGFTIEATTVFQLQAALAESMITQTSPQRILNELWLLLGEPRPEDALHMLWQLDALNQLLLTWSDQWRLQFSAARSTEQLNVPLAHVYVGLLVWPLNQRDRADFRRRYNLPSAERHLLDELPERVPTELEQHDITDYELEQCLQRLSDTALRTLQLVASPVAALRIAHYLVNVRSLPPLLTGNDLRVYGVAPGPQYRAILSELREVQLQRNVTTRDDALRWLEQRLR